MNARLALIWLVPTVAGATGSWMAYRDLTQVKSKPAEIRYVKVEVPATAAPLARTAPVVKSEEKMKSSDATPSQFVADNAPEFVITRADLIPDGKVQKLLTSRSIAQAPGTTQTVAATDQTQSNQQSGPGGRGRNGGMRGMNGNRSGSSNNGGSNDQGNDMGGDMGGPGGDMGGPGGDFGGGPGGGGPGGFGGGPGGGGPGGGGPGGGGPGGGEA